MNRKESSFGIAKENILVSGISNTRSNEQRTVLLGSIVKIESVLENSNLAVRFLDKQSSGFEEAVFRCHSCEVWLVSESLWPLLQAVPSPMLRVDLASSPTLHNQIASLKVGCGVEVLHNKIFYKGVIKYIGAVQAMGAGSVFGLELLVRVIIIFYFLSLTK